MLNYPLELTRDSNGEFLLTIPDIPEAAAVGDTEEAALREGLDALESALDFYFSDRRMVPLPRKAKKGQLLISLPALPASKVLLHNEMVTQGVKKADLARRLNMAPPNVERIFNLKHSTRIETIELALASMGKHLDVRVA